MKSVGTSIIFVLLFFCTLVLKAAASCRSALFSSHPALQELAKMRIVIDTRSTNDFVMMALRPQYDEKKSQLISALNISAEDFQTWLRLEIVRIQQERGLERESENLTQNEQKETLLKRRFTSQIRFVTIPPGTPPQMSQKISSGEIFMRSSDSFEISDTPISQNVWTAVAQLARLHLSDKEHDYPLQPSFFSDYDTHPVENLTQIEINRWINDLNKLSENKLRRAELKEIIPDFEGYDAFTLVPDNQLTWAIYWLTGINPFESAHQAGLGALTGKVSIGSSANPLPSTLEIGANKPIISPSGLPIWDVLGNVDILTEGSYIYQNSGRKVVRILGGSFQNDQLNGEMAPDERSRAVGFRLKRIRRSWLNVE